MRGPVPGVVAACCAAVVMVAGCATSTSGRATGVSAKPRATAGKVTASRPSATTRPVESKRPPGGAPCDYRETADEPSAGKDVGPPPRSERDEPGSVTLRTDRGDIAITLDVEAAPCTTRSVRHLAEAGFYDGSPCHRMTAVESLRVLQCGDPSGTGTGGPGYTIPDENPTGLPPATGGLSRYPRGTVAMANTGAPHSGGSQFFLVYADSTLPPTYAVFGRVDAAGLAVLDKVAAGGVTPGNGAGDGAPTLPITIERAVASD